MNAEQLKELLARIPIPPLIGIAALYFGYQIYSFLYDPASPLLMKREQVTQLDMETKLLLPKIQEQRRFIASLEVKKNTIRQLQQKLGEMKEQISDTFDVPGFMQTTITEAKKSGLSVLTLKPTEKNDKDLYSEQTFDFGFRGVFIQLVIFLNRLSQMHSIVRADSFDVKPIGSRVAPYVTLEGIVKIKGYHYLKSKADEVTAPAQQGAPPAKGAGA